MIQKKFSWLIFSNQDVNNSIFTVAYLNFVWRILFAFLFDNFWCHIVTLCFSCCYFNKSFFFYFQRFPSSSEIITKSCHKLKESTRCNVIITLWLKIWFWGLNYSKLAWYSKQELGKGSFSVVRLTELWNA